MVCKGSYIETGLHMIYEFHLSEVGQTRIISLVDIPSAIRRELLVVWIKELKPVKINRVT